MKFCHTFKLITAIALYAATGYSGKGLAYFSTAPIWMKSSDVARAISKLQRRLSKEQLQNYSESILVAARTYNIHPMTLVAIAHQESSFRQNIAEGPAGEIGMCQILKSWITHRKFIAEFGFWSKSKLKQPLNNFLAAAWILSDLKRYPSNHGKIPYWSYYNARKFTKRVAYFKRVSRQLGKLYRAGFDIPIHSASKNSNRTLAYWKPKLKTKLIQRNPSSEKIRLWKPRILSRVANGWISRAEQSLKLK